MTERVGVIARVRALAVGIAKAWVDQQKSEAARRRSQTSLSLFARRRAKKEKLSPVGS